MDQNTERPFVELQFLKLLYDLWSWNLYKKSLSFDNFTLRICIVPSEKEVYTSAIFKKEDLIVFEKQTILWEPGLAK